MDNPQNGYNVEVCSYMHWNNKSDGRTPETLVTSGNKPVLVAIR